MNLKFMLGKLINNLLIRALIIKRFFHLKKLLNMLVINNLWNRYEFLIYQKI